MQVQRQQHIEEVAIASYFYYSNFQFLDGQCGK